MPLNGIAPALVDYNYIASCCSTVAAIVSIGNDLLLSAKLKVFSNAYHIVNKVLKQHK